MKIEDLKIQNDLIIRSGFNEDAVQRYMELYQNGNEKAIKVQTETNVVVDGLHRIEAHKRLGLKDILVDPIDVSNSEL